MESKERQRARLRRVFGLDVCGRWRTAPTCIRERDHPGKHFDPMIGAWEDGEFHRPYVRPTPPAPPEGT